MQKVDKTVIKETKYIAYFVLVLSVLLEAVFLLIGKWDYRVLLGNLLGAFAAIANFFIMGLSVQKAVGEDEKRARSVMKTSQTLRFFGIFVIAMIGVLAPCFNTVSSLVPLFFPRFAIAVRPLIDKKK